MINMRTRFELKIQSPAEVKEAQLRSRQQEAIALYQPDWDKALAQGSPLAEIEEERREVLADVAEDFELIWSRQSYLRDIQRMLKRQFQDKEYAASVGERFDLHRVTEEDLVRVKQELTDMFGRNPRTTKEDVDKLIKPLTDLHPDQQQAALKKIHQKRLEAEEEAEKIHQEKLEAQKEAREAHQENLEAQKKAQEAQK
jgi:hypothetical protein